MTGNLCSAMGGVFDIGIGLSVGATGRCVCGFVCCWDQLISGNATYLALPEKTKAAIKIKWMPPPEMSPALRRILDHYSQARSSAYERLAQSDRVRIEDEVLELEKEIFAEECSSNFGTIRDLLVSASPVDRIAAVMILYRGYCSDDAMLRLLLERLTCESDSEALQQLILWFRYHHKDARAVGAICKLSDHSDYMVRTCVADALGAYRDNGEAVAALQRLTRDPHPNVREAATEKLPGAGL